MTDNQTQPQVQEKVIEVPAFFSKEDYHKMIYVTYINVQELRLKFDELLKLVKQDELAR